MYLHVHCCSFDSDPIEHMYQTSKEGYVCRLIHACISKNDENFIEEIHVWCVGVLKLALGLISIQRFAVKSFFEPNHP